MAYQETSCNPEHGIDHYDSEADAKAAYDKFFTTYWYNVDLQVWWGEIKEEKEGHSYGIPYDQRGTTR